MPSPMLGKVFLSVKCISTPPMTVMDTVTDAMIRAARGAVSGLRCRRFNARGWTGGGATGLPSGVVMTVTSLRSVDTGRCEQERIRSPRATACRHGVEMAPNGPREQALLRRSDELAQRFLNSRRQR